VLRRFRIPGLLLAALVSAGCGGGGGGSAAPSGARPPTTPTSAAKAPVTFTIAIPGRTPNKRGRLPQYISSATSNATIVYTPSGGTPAPPVYANCQATCTASFTANVGVDSFDVTLYDKDEKALSHGITTAVVDPALTNAIQVTFNGIVHDAALRTVPAALPAGSPGTALMFVDAHDADGATIVTDGTYVDANGTQVLFSVGDLDTSGATSINSSGVTAPGTVIPIAYNGSASFGAQFALTTTSTLPGAVTGTTLAITPTTVFTYPLLGYGYVIINGDGNHFYGITSPIGGSLSKRRAPQTHRRRTSSPSGGPAAIFACCDSVTSHAFAPADFSSPNLAYSPTNTTLYTGSDTLYGFPVASGPSTPISLSALPHAASNEAVANVAIGPGPNVYYTAQSDDGDYVGYADLGLTAATELAVPSGNAGSNQIVPAADGNLWFVETLGNKVGKFTPPGASPASLVEVALPDAGDVPFYVVDSPLHNAVIVLGEVNGDPNAWALWKIGYTAGDPASANRASVFLTLPTGTDGFGYFALHATGTPASGVLWTIDGSTGNFARIDMASKTTIEFPALATNPYLTDFAFGSDGSIYYVGQNLIGVGHLVP
jgi:hypothetical protein